MEIIQRAQAEWIEFKEAKKMVHREEVRKIKVEEKKDWQPPAMGCIKMNVSTVCDKSCNKVGIGITARDENKKSVQAWSVARDWTINPVVAEVEAVRIALLMAQQNGWHKVEIQVDIKALVESFQT